MTPEQDTHLTKLVAVLGEAAKRGTDLYGRLLPRKAWGRPGAPHGATNAAPSRSASAPKGTA